MSNRRQWLVVIAVGLLAWAAASGIANREDEPDINEPSNQPRRSTSTVRNQVPRTAAEGKFEQTWSASYGSTTCADWHERMTPKQRWVAAADMLVGSPEDERWQDGPARQPDFLVRERHRRRL